MLQSNSESLFIVDNEFAPFCFCSQAETAFPDLCRFLFVLSCKCQDRRRDGICYFEIIKIVTVHDGYAFTDVVACHMLLSP